MEKKISFPGIGKVNISKKRRVKRVSIRITPEGTVKVVIPTWVAYQEGLLFLEKKKSWVLKTLDRMQQEKPPDRTFHPGDNAFTRHHRLFLKPIHTDRIIGKIQERITTVTYPLNLSVYNPQLKEMINRIYTETLRVEARRYLPERVNQLATQHGYTYRKVFVKNMKTRWGSCSSALNINLNIHLMQLPSHLIDYVILHELTHTVHKNHGTGFWQELDKITGKAKMLDKELKNTGLKKILIANQHETA